MVQTPAKPLTLNEFLDLPETEPASEYIDGRIIQKPMPQGEHSAIHTELAPAINLVVKPKQIARVFCELRCSFGNRLIVPDISVFMWDRIPRKENGGVANVFSIAPDWTIEILSPDQSQTKVIPLLSLSGRAIARSLMRKSIQTILLEKNWSCICY
ncbi:MAG: Uma2 family endonuclease [Nostoc sp. ChiQUE02]|uniref:Uma2 family endonuclease n=1 Tax=Nostoc sp. ChiQUE02 TaxID=3075377 RepID=UPI002AD26DD3|nr:Uma2 family endonuclease [Nostoc sp. ChiQUE02]MDZ8234779.1 Uma2 family endonuclease [Nostoc sp. ChiQUE02]